MSRDDENLLGRWSRRKRKVAEEDAASEARGDEALEAPGPVPEPEESEEEALARLGLPDPDSLGEGDDFTGFMQAGVPEMLRRRALRRLWRTNPVFADIDGLVEYGENYAAPELVPEIVATAYKVGRGFVKAAVEEAAEDGPVEIPLETAAEQSAAAETEVAVPSKDDPLSHPTGAAPQSEAVAPPDPDAEIAFRPKRMRFRSDT